MPLLTVTMRPVNCRDFTHVAGASACSDGASPISRIVVWNGSSATTSPRTPPMTMRSPTENVDPRRMMTYAANAVITRCSANAMPAVNRPAIVASRAGLSNHTETSANRRTTRSTRPPTCRSQNDARVAAPGLTTRPNIALSTRRART